VLALVYDGENRHVLSRKKVDFEKVFASLNTVCPKCGKVISPSEIRRVSFDEMICPQCGEKFTPQRNRADQ
jgi:ribosomal protein S27AE